MGKLIGCAMILLAIIGVSVMSRARKRTKLEPHQVPASFACQRCGVTIANVTGALGRNCDRCHRPMRRKYAMTATASVGASARMIGEVFASGLKDPIKRLKVWPERFRRDGSLHHNEILDDRSDAARGEWHKHKVVRDDGAVIKDAEGLQKDPAIHGEVKRRMHPGSPRCSACGLYAVSRCGEHGSLFCKKHGAQHISEQPTDSDNLQELLDDLL